MSTLIKELEDAQLRRVPQFRAGDRVRVHFQVIEGSRSRTQVFEGIVIKQQGSGLRKVFTVRKNSFGVGVERSFPLHSPKIEKIEVAARGEVRRSKLYYLRDRIGKRARVRERTYTGEEEIQYVGPDNTALVDNAGVEEEAVTPESLEATVDEAITTDEVNENEAPGDTEASSEQAEVVEKESADDSSPEQEVAEAQASEPGVEEASSEEVTSDEAEGSSDQEDAEADE